MGERVQLEAERAAQCTTLFSFCRQLFTVAFNLRCCAVQMYTHKYYELARYILSSSANVNIHATTDKC